jgi:hypothetical protein
VPRAQKKRAARAAAASPRPAVTPVRTSPVPAVAAVPTWSRRSLLVLTGLVGVLQLLFGLIDMARDGHRYAYGVYLVASLAPLSLLQQLEVLLGFVIVTPVARRLAGEPRPLSLLETVAVGAVALILLTALWQLALAVTGGHALASKGHVATGALVAGAAADVAGLVLAALVYPPIHRRFVRRLAPRR